MGRHYGLKVSQGIRQENSYKAKQLLSLLSSYERRMPGPTADTNTSDKMRIEHGSCFVIDIYYNNIYYILYMITSASGQIALSSRRLE